MKTIKYFFITVLITFFGLEKVSSQSMSQRIISFNDTRTILRNNGFLANNFGLNAPFYEVPKGGGNHTVYAFSPLWIGKVDDSLVGAAAIYEHNNAFPGPIASDYNNAWHETTRKVFSINKFIIESHQQNWDDPTHVIHDDILDWPAMGQSAFNTSQYTAPFVDFNESGVYEPHEGDYPLIVGDQAIFAIYNYDSNAVENDLNNVNFPLEVQVMVYQFQSQKEWLDQTTFIHYRVKNKSDKIIKDFQWGSYVDIDIGFAFDDYFGSDSTRNLVYGYNGPNFDSGWPGTPGYGMNPPAQGIVLLNKDLFATNKMTYDGTHDIDNLNDLYNSMQGNDSQGSPNTNSQGNEVKFIYGEPPYVNGSESMYQLGMDDDVQRNVISTYPIDLYPGEVECYHYGFVYGRNFSDHILSVEEVINRTDSVQKFFNEEIDLPCDFYNGTMNVNTVKENVFVNIYPNPSNEIITFESNSEIEAFQVFSSDGKLILEEQFGLTNKKDVDISSFNNGVYITVIQLQNGERVHKRILKN